jgi:precorrin-2/cobalt-factor-2 C20-methyltransferase
MSLASVSLPSSGPLLVGVGVGPGDPDLVTVKAVHVLNDADVVVVPVMDLEETGRAERTVRRHLRHDRVRRLLFALDDRGGVTDSRRAAWEAAADEVAALLSDEDDSTVAFATIGDPNVYSTFTYLADAVRERVPDVVVETVPGITAMQDLAARSGTVLCEGTESLALLPLTAGVAAFDEALTHFDTVVAYKGGRHMPAVRDVLRRHGREDDAVFGSSLGLPDERVSPAAQVAGEAPYLSTVIVPARRSGRGSKLTDTGGAS